MRLPHEKMCVCRVDGPCGRSAACRLAGLAVEYFADAVNGSDSYDGTAAKWAGGESTVGPKKTVQAAVNLADGNGTIITLLPGVYDEGGDVNTSNYPQSNRVVITKSNVILTNRPYPCKRKSHVGAGRVVHRTPFLFKWKLRRFSKGLRYRLMPCAAEPQGITGLWRLN